MTTQAVTEDVKPEKTPQELLAEVQAALDAERTARKQAESNLSSLRGQIRSQNEIYDEMHGRMAGVEKTVGLLARGLSNPEVAERLPAEVDLMQRELAQTTAQRRFETTYAALLNELRTTVTGEDGKPIFDLETAPELEAVRAFWREGREGNGTMTERTLLFQKAVGEATRAVVQHERKVAREARKTAEAQEQEERKRQKAATLDIDTGGSGSKKGQDTTGLTPAERIALGLKKARASGKPHSIYDRE